MGAWKELDTEIEIEVDTTELDSLTKFCRGEEYLSEALEYSEKIKRALHKGSEQASEQLSDMDISYQKDFINKKCKHPSNKLASSIDKDKIGDYHYLIGTSLNEIYPMSIEYGRRGFGPKRAKALAFYYDGQLIFRKKVRKAKAKPFVAPAYKKVQKSAEKIVKMKIGQNLKLEGVNL